MTDENLLSSPEGRTRLAQLARESAKRGTEAVREKVDVDKLPSVVDILAQLTTPNTIYEYPESDLMFDGSAQSTVKCLKVNVLSTESKDLSILRRLHSRTHNEN